MKKSNKEVKKKDSIASLVVDKKDSLKAPLIIETLDIDDHEGIDDIEDNEAGDEKMRARFLSKGDLPRNLRSTRRLSAFNEQLYEQQQLFLSTSPIAPSRKPSTASGTRRPSKEVKAASCDAISDSQQEKPVVSSGHKSVQVNQCPPRPTSVFASPRGSTEERPNTWNQRFVCPSFISRILPFFQSMPSLNDRQNQPIWGQFHFFPNVSSQFEIEQHWQQNPSNLTLNAATASFTSNTALYKPDRLRLDGTATSQPPIVLLPSSYDLAKEAGDGHGEEGCFNIILVGGCLLLLITISAAVALISGFI